VANSWRHWTHLWINADWSRQATHVLQLDTPHVFFALQAYPFLLLMYFIVLRRILFVLLGLQSVHPAVLAILSSEYLYHRTSTCMEIIYALPNQQKIDCCYSTTLMTSLVTTIRHLPRPHIGYSTWTAETKIPAMYKILTQKNERQCKQEFINSQMAELKHE